MTQLSTKSALTRAKSEYAASGADRPKGNATAHAAAAIAAELSKIKTDLSAATIFDSLQASTAAELRRALSEGAASTNPASGKAVSLVAESVAHELSALRVALNTKFSEFPKEHIVTLLAPATAAVV